MHEGVCHGQQQDVKLFFMLSFNSFLRFVPSQARCSLFHIVFWCHGLGFSQTRPSCWVFLRLYEKLYCVMLAEYITSCLMASHQSNCKKHVSYILKLRPWSVCGERKINVSIAQLIHSINLCLWFNLYFIIPNDYFTILLMI